MAAQYGLVWHLQNLWNYCYYFFLISAAARQRRMFFLKGTKIKNLGRQATKKESKEKENKFSSLKIELTSRKFRLWSLLKHLTFSINLLKIVFEFFIFLQGERGGGVVQMILCTYPPPPDLLEEGVLHF